eukprot:879443-Ditylum_brightwellii.AAC.1
MKLVIAALLAASASAFVPAQDGKTSTFLNTFEDELGAQPPLSFFEPLGMLTDVNQEHFNCLCYIEVKHGCICQLVFLGQIVTHNRTHLPGSIDMAGDSFDSYPNGIAALFGDNTIPRLDSANGAEPGDFPGDF